MFTKTSLALLLGISLVLIFRSSAGQECPPGEVVCQGSDECVKEEYVCDFEWSDCANGWDELDCPCMPYEYRCANTSECIPDYSAGKNHDNLVCDGYPQCPHEDDEDQDCPPLPPCEGFQCYNGDCIHKSWKCDGVADCIGGEDEEGCPPCGGYVCIVDGRCIPKSWVCDGLKDCAGGDDEDNCPCNGFLCDDGLCIPEHYVCDDDEDCGGGEDEQNCTCGVGKVQCSGSNKCIPDYWLCDFVSDCPGGSDEADCEATTANVESSLQRNKRRFGVSGQRSLASKRMEKRKVEKMRAQKVSWMKYSHLDNPKQATRRQI